ncbi:MAG: hypothetical protein R3E86_04245 [Pseudomonadales bacterium]
MRSRSMTIVLIMAAVLGLLVAAALAHLAFIEIGREVVVLVTTDADGKSHARRLWAVDHEGSVWLHSTGESWHQLFREAREVELKRNGRSQRYDARAVPGPHPTIDGLLRAKYGLADRWVRFLAPCDEHTLVVRLSRIDGAPDPAAGALRGR